MEKGSHSHPPSTIPANFPSTPIVAFVSCTLKVRNFLTGALHQCGVFTSSFDTSFDLLHYPGLSKFQLVVADWTRSPFSGGDLWHILTQKGFTGRVAFMSSHVGQFEKACDNVGHGLASIDDAPFPLRKMVARIIDHLALIEGNACSKPKGELASERIVRASMQDDGETPETMPRRMKKTNARTRVATSQRLDQLENEIAELKRLVADLTLDKSMLQDALTEVVQSLAAVAPCSNDWPAQPPTLPL